MGVAFLPFFVVLGAGVLLLGVVAIVFFGRRPAAAAGTRRQPAAKDRSVAIREANRRLAQNPKDADALAIIADVYYNEESWDKAAKSYGVLMNMCATNPDLDEAQITLRYGLSAMKTRNFEEAYKGLVLARTFHQDVFEIEYNLGYLEYRRKNYEKAVTLLTAAQQHEKEHIETAKYLGLSLYRLKNYPEALGLLRKTLDSKPDDKEVLFVLGQCYSELGQTDQAVRIFTHLRPDPLLGPQACLHAGTLHAGIRQFDKAQLDFEIGLRHQKIRPEVLLELKYRLAAVHSKLQDIGHAVPLLTEIYDANPDYKDVREQIGKLRELADNQNLQTYLLAPPADFVTLCRRIVAGYFDQAKVSVTDISVTQNDFADVMCEVETSSWQDTMLFRFFRVEGAIGELAIREFNSRLKEAKAGRGFCLTAGEFSEGAKHFVEARLIDLVEKDDLLSVMSRAATQ